MILNKNVTVYNQTSVVFGFLNVLNVDVSVDIVCRYFS